MLRSGFAQLLEASSCQAPWLPVYDDNRKAARLLRRKRLHAKVRRYALLLISGRIVRIDAAVGHNVR